MSESLVWRIDSFEELDIIKLYKILRLRAEIFVVEQNAAYLDLDNKDQKALHIQGYDGDELVAYCRIFRRGDYFVEASVGRVVVATKHRRHSYGHVLMQKAIDALSEIWQETRITISAQLYLKEFYESHGFAKTSEVYMEDGLPHIEMKRI